MRYLLLLLIFNFSITTFAGSGNGIKQLQLPEDFTCKRMAPYWRKLFNDKEVFSLKIEKHLYEGYYLGLVSVNGEREVEVKFEYTISSDGWHEMTVFDLDTNKYLFHLITRKYGEPTEPVLMSLYSDGIYFDEINDITCGPFFY